MFWLAQLFKFRQGGPDEEYKPFLDHLEDLRWTVVKMAIALVSCMILAFVFRVELTRIVQRPLADVDADALHSLHALGVGDSISISFQLSFYAGLVLALPLLLHFAAQFILPGLTKKERNYLLPVIIAGTGLFICGVLFSYYAVLPATLSFMYADQQQFDWQPNWGVSDYFSFVTQFSVGFGMAFELPLVVMALVKLNMLTVKFMAQTRSYAYVLLVTLAAIITPTTDILTLVLMSGPLLILYEICILLAWILERRAADPERPPKA